MVHLLVVHGGGMGDVSCETNRLRFIGRGGTLASPEAMRGGSPLSNTVGFVLDPVVSLRHTVSLPPHGTAGVDLLIGMAETREIALAQVEKYQGPRMTDRAFDLAWTHSQVTLRQLSVTEREAQLYGRLAGALVFADPARRAGPGILRKQPPRPERPLELWDLRRRADHPAPGRRAPARMEMVRQLVQAHAYWRIKGLAVELVILERG